MTPADLLRKKETYAVALTTEQVDALSQEFRERAAWIVGQEEAYIIEAYYRTAADIADGKLSMAEARRRIREVLDAAGYQADAPGTWKDLQHGTARQKMVLETNLDKAAARSWYEAVKNDPTLPAQRLVRTGRRRHERDWNARWRAAYAALPPEQQARACATQPVALLDCAIWRALSRWGDPYPPYDYGSGMDVEPVDADTAAALGLPVGTHVETADEAATPSLSETLPAEQRSEIQDWIKQAEAML